jgi:hypothetical protein
MCMACEMTPDQMYHLNRIAEQLKADMAAKEQKAQSPEAAPPEAASPDAAEREVRQTSNA